MRKWLKQIFCRHQFQYRDMVLTGIPKPAEPTGGYDEWMKWYQNLDKSDWHLKRVRWPCCKCHKVFEAHSGLEILEHGRCIGR